MAYDSGTFGSGIRSIIVLPGSGQNDSNTSYRYFMDQDSWAQLSNLPNREEPDDPDYEYEGTCLTTRTPVLAPYYSPYPLVLAALYGEGEDDYPYYYDATGDHHWHEWVSRDTVDSSIYCSRLPGDVDAASTMVIGGYNMMFLIPEGTGRDFYCVDLPTNLDSVENGGQAVVSRVGGTKAHVIASRDRIEVEYQLPASARVHATLHNAVGRLVGSLNADAQKPGIHRLSWSRDREGRRLSAGAYFVLLDVGAQQARLKAVVE